MKRQVRLNRQRLRRQKSVRRRISGTDERPRLAVFRSSKQVYAQIIDDHNGLTLVSASSMDKALREQLAKGSNREAAEAVGKELGRRAAEKGIKAVAFDRRHYKYHGRVRALAEGVRSAGISF